MEEITKMTEMENEIMTVRQKYNPYFKLEKEVLSLKRERTEILLKVEGACLFGIGMCLGDLMDCIFDIIELFVG